MPPGHPAVAVHRNRCGLPHAKPLVLPIVWNDRKLQATLKMSPACLRCVLWEYDSETMVLMVACLAWLESRWWLLFFVLSFLGYRIHRLILVIPQAHHIGDALAMQLQLKSRDNSSTLGRAAITDAAPQVDQMRHAAGRCSAHRRAERNQQRTRTLTLCPIYQTVADTNTRKNAGQERVGSNISLLAPNR